jgi:hypothetical protein
MQKPNEFVFNEVQKKWSYERSKGFFRKLIGFGQIKAVAIDIFERESIDEKRGFCTGKVLNAWRYDDAGLRLIPKDTKIDSYKVEHCEYCFDEEKKKLMVTWANILSGGSNRKHIHYFHDGVAYDIVEKDGVEELNVVNAWIE